MAKRIAILGSTGSIGRSSLRVIEALGEGYEVFALTGHNNVELLAEQVRKFRPKVVAISNCDLAGKLKGLVGGVDVEILAGPGSLVEVTELSEVDTVLTAVVGAAGLGAVLAAAQKGKRLAIANKEPLVIAGKLLMETAAVSGAEVLPVDSEHSAIFQSLQAGRNDEINKIILTTSGGPFRKFSVEDVKSVTKEQALEHPTWNMGPKITIDSATMMNKSLEVIEAHWLFGVGMDKIEVLVHPESIVHSLVEFVDGSVIAQLGSPDMCLPIQYALTYPSRVKGIAKRLKLDELGKLTFEKPNMEVFKSLRLAYEVAELGGTAPAVFNAANEQAVAEFLAGTIEFSGIVELIEQCLSSHNVKPDAGLEELLDADNWARQEVKRSLQLKTN